MKVLVIKIFNCEDEYRARRAAEDVLGIKDRSNWILSNSGKWLKWPDSEESPVIEVFTHDG